MEMSEQALVESLLDRWMAAQEQGVTLRVDDLCQTCPDLREALAERIADLQSFENRLAAAMRKAEAAPEPDDFAQLDLQLASGINSLQFHAKGGLGAVFIGEKPTSLDGLITDLSATLAKEDPATPPNEQRVYIRADKSVRYGDFMAVMNTLQGNGFYQVALINEELS